MNLHDLIGLPSIGFELGEELCVNDDCGLKFDDTQYLSLEVFSHKLRELTMARRGKGKYKAFAPIESLRVNGSVKSEPMDRYLEAEAINSSLVKEAMISPRQFFIARTMPIKPRNTKHFEIGTFAHSAILEPSKFNKIYPEPSANKSTTEGCVELLKFYTRISGLPAIDTNGMKISRLREEITALVGFCEDRGYEFIDSYNTALVEIMRKSVITYADGIIPKIMYYAKKELSMYGEDPGTGLPIKIRPDAVLLEEDFGANVIVSVKTTSELDPPAFDRDCARRKYEVAEGMYLDAASHITGRKFTGTLMIVVQTVPPFQAFLKWWNAEDLQIGRYKYAVTMETIRACIESDNYPGFEALAEEGHFGIIESRLPGYIQQDLPPQYVKE